MSNSPISEIAFYPVFMLPEHLHWPEDFDGQFSRRWEAGLPITLVRLLSRVSMRQILFSTDWFTCKIQAVR
jgi:hypothetical protein